MSKPADYRMAFEDLKKAWSDVLSKIKNATSSELSGACSDTAKIKQELTNSGKTISHESNKLALSFKSSPIPTAEDARSMGGKMEAGLVQLLGVYLSLPSNAGIAYTSDIKRFCVDVAEAAVLFSDALIASVGKKKDQMGELILQAVGGVWEKCDVAASLPESALESVQRRLRVERRMVEDALKELEDAVETAKDDEYEDFEDSWPEEDMKLVSFGVGLVKASQALFKKVALSLKKNGKSETPEQVVELDSLLELIESFSATVDDTAMTVYAPLDYEELAREAATLRALDLKVIDGVAGKHYIVEAELNQWGAFLKKAIEHNYTELEKIALERGVSDLTVK